MKRSMLADPADDLRSPGTAIRSAVRALRIAPNAIRSVRSGSGWRLLSSHAHAVNFVDTSGKLISLTQDPIRMGPFSIELDSLPDDLGLAHPGHPIQIEPGDETRIVIEGRSVDLTTAAHWNPRPDWSTLLKRMWQPECLPAMLSRLRRSAPRESLACVAQMLNGRDESPRDTSLQQMAQSSAVQSALRLIRALGEHQLQTAAEAAAALTGTGLGLTPSGDDFIIGVMFGAWSTLPAVRAKALSALLARDRAARTNRISQAWLSAAVDGQAIQAWHDLVQSILSCDRAAVDRACHNLMALGHTSGADALTGFTAYHLVCSRSLSATS